jgi:mono/diheme cytochrome c family protein
MNKKVTRIISLMAVFGCVTIGFTSCSKHDENSPGVEFMPDMYRSPSLEANLANVVQNEDGTFDTIISNRQPVAGTIARGYMPYAYANTTEGYEAAGANLRNPFSKNEANLKEGEVLYGKFCVHCHGAGGEGDGLVGGKLPGAPPSYKTVLKTLPEGKIFHSMTYGKGLMGSHAGQLTKEERWKLVLYVQKLQGNDAPATAVASDSTKTDSTAVVVKVEEPKK